MNYSQTSITKKGTNETHLTKKKKKDSSNQKDKRKPPKNPKNSIFKRKKINFIVKLEKLT